MNTTVDIVATQDKVLLTTAVIDIQDCTSKFQPIRAEISEKTLQRLIAGSKFSINISGLGQMSSNVSKVLNQTSLFR